MLLLARRWSLGLVAAFFAVGVLHAQSWKKIGTLPVGSDLRCAYFWDVNHGVVGGAQCIYTYVNGTWTEASYPESPDTIKTLRLLDTGHLYAASGDVWVSTDHGATWQRTGLNLTDADDLYLGADGAVHGMNINGENMMIGTTFARAGANCVAARDDLPNPAYSPNNGAIWFSSQVNLEDDDGYSVVADSCSGIFYTLTDGPKIELYESATAGATWNMIYDFDQNTGDILAGGDAGVLYVRGLNHFVYRSLNGGKSFQNIWGTQAFGNTSGDRRMFAFGETNRSLVLFDGSAFDNNVVWLWDDSLVPGEVSVFTESHVAAPTSDCDTVLIPVVLSSTCCALPIVLDSASSTPPLPIDSAISDLGKLGCPDTVWFIAILTWPEQENYTFHVFGHTQSGVLFDTSLASIVQAPQSAAPQFQFPNATIDLCTSDSLPLIITDPGCGLWKIVSVSFGGLGSILSLQSGFDSTLMMGQTDTLWFRVTLSTSGLISGTVQIQLKSIATGQISTVNVDVLFHIAVQNPRVTLASIAKPPCVSAKVPVLVHTPPCGRWSLDSVLLYNMGSVAQVLGGFDSILGPSQTDTIWIQTNGSVPGTTSGGVELFFHSLTNPLLYDTTLPAAVRILNSAPVVVAATSYYLSNCRTSIIPVLLQALNCDSVSIFSCTVTCKGANFTTDLTFPRILEIGEIDTLHVTIPPQSLSGPYEITIRVKGVSFGSIVGFDTTVTILVMFTTDSHALSVIPNSLSFDSISICNLALDTFRLTNVGCGPIVLTSDETQWPRGWSVLDPVFPDTLDADSSVTVQLQFQPYDLSSSQFSIEYAFDYGGGKTSAVELNVAAQVMPAPAQLTLSDTAIDFGTLRRCQTTAHDSVIVITNTGCDSLSLTRAFVVNGAGFTLNGGNDTTLPPHGSARYALHFSDSTVQNYASAFHVTGTGAHGGNEIDPSVPLVAAIVSGDRSASIAPDSILFGTTTLCEERDSFVTITNTGCEADTVLSASFSSDEFAFGPSVSFPDTLAPGASIPFPIVTHLDTTGHPNSVSALLSFVLDSGISLPAIPVLRAVTYPTRFSLSLAASPQSKVHAFDTVWIRRIGTIPSGVDELDFDLIYNDNLLEYAGKNESDILAGTGTVLANGLTSRTFQMKPASDRDTLATLSFQTYLTKELTTSIALANPKFFVSGALASACVASLDSSGGPSQFKLELSCGDSSILAAWNSSPPFTIESINPNPAEKEFQVTGSGFSKEMKIELYNVLGDVVISPQLPSSPLEPASFTLDVSQLAAGSYYLRVSVEGYTVTRPVSISR